VRQMGAVAVAAVVACCLAAPVLWAAILGAFERGVRVDRERGGQRINSREDRYADRIR
jgi:hypothetical protein